MVIGGLRPPITSYQLPATSYQHPLRNGGGRWAPYFRGNGARARASRRYV
jgi:hypothetical protein